MNGTKSIAVVVLMMCLARTAPASIFGKKTPKVDPAQRVPQLLYNVQMEQDEKKRVAAAAELREYDSKQFPEIVFILADIVQTDKSSAVRAEAVQSLGKIRPITATAGQALEHATKDSVMRVRMQASSSLRMYQLAGYRAGASNDAKAEVVKPVPSDVKADPKAEAKAQATPDQPVRTFGKLLGRRGPARTNPPAASAATPSDVNPDVKADAKPQQATPDQPVRTIGKLLQLRGTAKSNAPASPASNPTTTTTPATPATSDAPGLLPSSPPFSTAIQPRSQRTTPPPIPAQPTTKEPTTAEPPQ